MSYDAMEKFIGLYSDSEERLKQFAAMRKCFAKQDRSYFRMKEWFKENYPDYEEQNHQMDEDGFLVAKETADVGVKPNDTLLGEREKISFAFLFWGWSHNFLGFVDKISTSK